MSDRQKQQILDGQEEKFLEDLFDAASQAKGEALWKVYEAEVEAGTAPEVPEALDAKCRELIQAAQKKPKRIQFRKFIGCVLKNVAIIALVLLAVVSIATVSVDAIRLPVLNFLTGRDNRYSMIYFGSEEPKTEKSSLFEKIGSLRRPDGYVLIDQWIQGDGSFGFWFENEDSSVLQVSFISSIHLVNYDVEDAEQVQTKVLEKDAILIKKNGVRIIWMDDLNNGVFDVRADYLEEKYLWEYVLNIAESLGE